jgi:hypothetical protein
MASILSFLRKPASHKAAHPGFLAERVHFFPLGGIAATTDYSAGLSPRTERERA